MKKQADRQRKSMREDIEASLAAKHPELNAVAADGGELSSDILNQLGEKKLKALLTAVLS